MAIAFDHLFICTTTNAPEVDHILIIAVPTSIITP